MLERKKIETSTSFLRLTWTWFRCFLLFPACHPPTVVHKPPPSLLSLSLCGSSLFHRPRRHLLHRRYSVSLFKWLPTMLAFVISYVFLLLVVSDIFLRAASSAQSRSCSTCQGRRERYQPTHSSTFSIRTFRTRSPCSKRYHRPQAESSTHCVE